MFTTLESSGSDRGSDTESNSTVLIELDHDDNTDTETIDSHDDYDDSDDHSYDDSGSDGGIEYDSIHNEDAFHFYSEKENGKYYIGLCHLYTHSTSQYRRWLLSTSVSANSFFRHSYDNINNYLYYYGLVRIPQHEVQIMQVDRLADETCSVTIKTHWLRLVQRHWKKTYCKRRNMVRHRMSPQMQCYSQIHGKYPDCISTLPSLRGMLSMYKQY